MDITSIHFIFIDNRLPRRSLFQDSLASPCRVVVSAVGLVAVAFCCKDGFNTQQAVHLAACGRLIGYRCRSGLAVSSVPAFQPGI